MLRIPRCLDNRLIDGGKVVSPTAALYSPETSRALYVRNKLRKFQAAGHTHCPYTPFLSHLNIFHMAAVIMFVYTYCFISGGYLSHA
jgi:hypothetical protein